MNVRLQALFAFVIIVCAIYGGVECNPRGGGGRGGSGNSSSAAGKASGTGSRKSGGTYLIGGLYPARRPPKEEPAKIIKKEKSSQTKNGPLTGITAWGIIGIALAMITLCSGVYYALYLCDVYHTNAKFNSYLKYPNAPLMTEKPKLQDGNGNGNIPMKDMNTSTKVPLYSGLDSDVYQ